MELKLMKRLKKDSRQAEGVPLFRWDTRMEKQLELQRGLPIYEIIPQIIHRDVKASKILLDHSFNAKVSDFCLAKLHSDHKTKMTTLVMGTFGHMDPEYQRTNKVTEKSDVFSYPVVLLEMITSTPSIIERAPSTT